MNTTATLLLASVGFALTIAALLLWFLWLWEEPGVVEYIIVIAPAVFGAIGGAVARWRLGTIMLGFIVGSSAAVVGGFAVYASMCLVTGTNPAWILWHSIGLVLIAVTVGPPAALFGSAAPPIVVSGIEKRRRSRIGHCPNCDYDLRGDLDSGCPECGWNRSEPRP